MSIKLAEPVNIGQIHAILANADNVDELVKFLEAHKADIAAEIARKRAEAAKVVKPVKGDMVVILDGNGQAVQFGAIVRKPSNITLIRWDGELRTIPVNTPKLERIGRGVWKLA